jgi:hypothetical protein
MSVISGKVLKAEEQATTVTAIAQSITDRKRSAWAEIRAFRELRSFPRAPRLVLWRVSVRDSRFLNVGGSA